MIKFKIPAEQIRAAMVHVAKGDVRYYLNGIHIAKTFSKTTAFVTIELFSALSAIKVTCEDHPTFLVIIMPCRIS